MTNQMKVNDHMTVQTVRCSSIEAQNAQIKLTLFVLLMIKFAWTNSCIKSERSQIKCQQRPFWRLL